MLKWFLTCKSHGSATPSENRILTLSLYTLYINTHLQCNFFTDIVVKHWNRLPREVLESTFSEVLEKWVDTALCHMVQWAWWCWDLMDLMNLKVFSSPNDSRIPYWLDRVVAFSPSPNILLLYNRIKEFILLWLFYFSLEIKLGAIGKKMGQSSGVPGPDNARESRTKKALRSKNATCSVVLGWGKGSNVFLSFAYTLLDLHLSWRRHFIIYVRSRGAVRKTVKKTLQCLVCLIVIFNTDILKTLPGSSSSSSSSPLVYTSVVPTPWSFVPALSKKLFDL